MNSSRTYTHAEQNKHRSRIVATVGAMNTCVARAHAKTSRELVKQTQNNEVNQSATTSKFPCQPSNHSMLLRYLLRQRRIGQAKETPLSNRCRSQIEAAQN